VNNSSEHLLILSGFILMVVF